MQLLRMILISVLAGVAAGIVIWVTGDLVCKLQLKRLARAEARRLREEAEAAKAAAEEAGEAGEE